MVICYINEDSRQLALDLSHALGSNITNSNILEWRHIVTNWYKDDVVIVVDSKFDCTVPQSEIIDTLAEASMIIHCVPGGETLVESGSYNRLGIDDLNPNTIEVAIRSEFSNYLNLR